jgi:hypothetical protein
MTPWQQWDAANITVTKPATMPVQEVVRLLESIQQMGICDPSSDEYAPVLPRCVEPHRVLHTEYRAIEIDQTELYLVNAFAAIGCVLIGAIMAGMLMGIMTLDPLVLAIKTRAAETHEERRNAAILLPYVQNKNMVVSDSISKQ